MTGNARPPHAAAAGWRALVAPWRRANGRRAAWQVVNTLGPYVLLWGAIYLSTYVSWWLTLPLAVLAGVMLVRVFIIFHDCCHGSFLASRRANDALGCLTGLMAFTPYRHWRSEHVIHHATVGDLGRRGIGDVWTMTVREYLAAPRGKRCAYRLVRHPVVLLGIAPLLLFVLWQRVPRPGASRRERRSVWWTNLLLLAIAAGMCWIFGVVPYVVIQLTVLAVAGAAGVCLFYLQHQFEDAYWERGADRDLVAAALQGSSFLDLPKVLQWFSGNIGFHHIHHLDARIPNYHLQRCHESDPLFRGVKALSLPASVRALGLRLWDESSKKLIGFRQLRRLRARPTARIPDA